MNETFEQMDAREARFNAAKKRANDLSLSSSERTEATLEMWKTCFAPARTPRLKKGRTPVRNQNYQRVIPRDLFNEAKLLKCLGQLSLILHNGVRWPLWLKHDTRKVHGFLIAQNPDDGGIYCANLTLYQGKRPILLNNPLNSRKPYPLLYVDPDAGEGPVFDDDGKLSAEFTAYLDKLAA